MHIVKDSLLHRHNTTEMPDYHNVSLPWFEGCDLEFDTFASDIATVLVTHAPSSAASLPQSSALLPCLSFAIDRSPLCFS